MHRYKIASRGSIFGDGSGAGARGRGGGGCGAGAGAAATSALLDNNLFPALDPSVSSPANDGKRTEFP